ncbi:LTA synthase family protein [Galbibacter pacificus]|uniref:LTA synthase family protein n=1 Tax=Galbibacter pacificus TaxID=2996052 RepID=A0ABT6FRZ8_9FLAO|nr:LTA synthase family protein [Galbibacter pacificus]MDG3582828.1 LTA synthase family protein [Galbibacter pacificus]MDG3586053.1 LTA synthase family protein [Galbibacter pacificus]
MFLLLELLFIFYYKSTLVLLGADIFSYSFNDIFQTVASSGGIVLMAIISLLIYGLGIVTTLNFFSRKVRLHLNAFPLFSILIGLTFIGNMIALKGNHLDFANNIITNKTLHFIKSTYHYYYPYNNETDIYAEAYLKNPFSSKAFRKFEYSQVSNFPFLHKSIDEDVLSPFFSTKKNKPDIVFIIVEGLGRAFSGENAYLGSFTPFLDSLAHNSLYWNNFLSNTGRTFGVLPSLFGSLPFAKNGYLDMGENMPQHLSLINLLKNHGYHTSFYYGGNASFDQMDVFLEKNKIDAVFDESTFPKTYKKLPSTNNFSWGYGDKELYQYYFETKREKSTRPRLDIILTISTHSPFKINNASQYTNLFEKHLSSLELSTKEKNGYRNYTDQYTTILYADTSIKQFFESYEKTANFENTIFVITGDHRLPEIPMQNKIDRYHVPLIIYSPMLNKSSAISSISSHFDVAPSMINFLSHNYQIKKPRVNSWLGYGLDTLKSFRNQHQIPLMQTKVDFVDYLVGTYHLNNNTLYKMNGHMEEYIIENDTLKTQIKVMFDNFKRKNAEISINKPILPDSIIVKYLP